MRKRKKKYEGKVGRGCQTMMWSEMMKSLLGIYFISLYSFPTISPM